MTIKFFLGIFVAFVIYHLQIQIDFRKYTIYVQSLDKVVKYKWRWFYVGHKKGLINIWEKENKKTEEELKNANI